MTEPLCTCDKRPKHKCCEESGVGGKMCLKDLEEDLRQSLFKKIAYGVSDSEISDKDKDILSKTTLMHILEQKQAYSGEPKPNNLSVEDSFDIMFGRYQHALKELSEK